MDFIGGGALAEDFSPAATVVVYDQPLPLLRAPIPAGPADDPSAGPFVLGFSDARTWQLALEFTRSKLFEQCLAGARVGCSISASNKCKFPWWKFFFRASPADFAERERCEEQEMAACLASSREACAQFANEKCLPPFRDARIAIAGANGMPKLAVSLPETLEIVPENNSLSRNHPEILTGSLKFDTNATNYRGSLLLGALTFENLDDDFLNHEKKK